jgi:iron complex transport system ATP-binding protein
VILEARNVGFAKDGRPLVSSVHFGVKAGESVAIIGPNGAGKSTLVKMIAGLLRPTEGAVLLDGSPIHAMSARAVALRIGYVPQSPPTNLPFTVGAFVAMARYARSPMVGGLDNEGRAAVEQALEMTGCAAMRGQAMHTLSGGEARKVHLAAALAQGGDVLLLDEPTTHLDYRHQREVAALLQQIRAEGLRTIVAVQHDLNQGVLQADRVLALKRGAVYHFGAPKDLTAELLEDLFDTPFDVLPVRQSAVVAPRYD